MEPACEHDFRKILENKEVKGCIKTRNGSKTFVMPRFHLFYYKFDRIIRLDEFIASVFVGFFYVFWIKFFRSLVTFSARVYENEKKHTKKHVKTLDVLILITL